MKRVPSNRPFDQEAGESMDAMDMVDDARLYAEESGDEAEMKQRHEQQFDKFESYHFHSRMDLETKHADAQRMLSEDQNTRSGGDIESWRNEQDSLEQNLHTGGVRGWWRDVTGRNEADRETLENVQKSLEAAEYRHEQELNGLKLTQAQEMRAREEDEASRRAYVENEQRVEQEAFKEKQREQSMEALENTTISNDFQKPEYVVEQDNLKPRVAPEFNQSSPTPAMELRAKFQSAEQQPDIEQERAEYIAAQIDPAPDVPQDRDAYIVEQQGQANEPPVDREAYIQEQMNEPSQDFQQVTQVQTQEPNR